MQLREAISKMKFWGERDKTPFASVLFPGPLPPRPEELKALNSAGLTTEPLSNLQSDQAHWGLRLAHPEWGWAEAVCFRDPIAPPRVIVDPCVNLTDEEKEAICGAGSIVAVRLKNTTENRLADRKRLFRFARAVMDEYGVAVGDHLSELFWSRQSLDEELAHEADVDVSALYVVHAVKNDKTGTTDWLHSHGLAEIGFFDFDILAPSHLVLGRGSDLTRAVAFAILEGNVHPSMASFTLAEQGGDVSFVEVAEFNRRAAAEHVALRDADEYHVKNRSVLCEPRTSFLDRWRKVRPSSFLSQADPADILIQFSTTATELMAARARGAYCAFRCLFEEFRDLELPAVVKLGYPTDSGGESKREHLWFSVHELHENSIEATLDNQPFDVSALRQGQRGTHSLDLLTDWTILTPAGWITPRDMLPARRIREKKDEIKKLMIERPQ